ncbi:hypothetical protein JT358_08325 [Micrococcales bacterium 31B]|nr:hypothetical protein [Micrococcales bacterium 31B]
MTLTPNPAWDMTHRVAELRPGASHRVLAASGRAGGKGINVARTLMGLFGPEAPLSLLPTGMREDFEHSRATCEVIAVAPVGGRIGELLAEDLERVAGLEARLVPVSGATRQSIAVVPDDGSHPTLLNEPGAPVAAAEWDMLVATTLDLLGEGSVLTVSGSMPPGPGAAGRSGLPELVRAARARGAQVLVDVSGAALAAVRDSGADLLKPNREEFLEVDPRGEGASFAPNSLVVVTDGARGMRAYVPRAGESDPGTGTGAPGAALTGLTLTGNPTGAGDAALAALAWFVAGYREGTGRTLRDALVAEASKIEGNPALRHDLEAMLTLAVAVSAAAVRAPVAGAVDLASLPEFFANNHITTL